MKSLEVLRKLIDQMMEDSYSPPGTVSRDGLFGVASLPPKGGYIDGDLTVFDKRTHADLKRLDADIWRLIDCYNTRAHNNGRRPGRCHHRWLMLCPKCGDRQADKY
jgi:hypothetical protein